MPAAAVAVTLVVYVRTLAPGLVAITDTPKFQFIGRILGVSHNPGYPLYSLVTHVFGYVPIESLAYRMNLFSAVCGALAAGLLALVLLRLPTHPVVALAVSTAFGFGLTYWETAIIAEVYTLHVLLVAAMTLALFTWGRTGEPLRFYLAVACFALALGHHTTIVLLAPAVVLYALLRNWRFVLRARTIATSVLLLGAGLAQYAFVIVRTRQGAYSESPARDLSELIGVLRGEQFTRFLVTPDPAGLFGRLPYLGGWFRSELTLAGLILAGVGALAFWRRDRAGLLYVVCGIGAVVAFGLYYWIDDIHLFLLPAFLLAWIAVALGCETLVTRLPRRAVPVALVALAALPAVQYARNIEDRDFSRRWAAARYVDALIRVLPERSALLREDFLVDRMVLYEVLGEDALRGRDVLAPIAADFPRIASLHASGYRIFAFSKTVARLRATGLDFSHDPVRVPYGTLERFIEDLPDGTQVALAIPAVHLPPMLPHASALPLVGAPAPSTGLDRISLAVFGRRGSPSAMHLAARRGTATVNTSISGVPVTVESGQLSAAIRLDTRVIIGSERGPVIAVWDRHGALQHAFAIARDGSVNAPAAALSVFELRAIRDWTEVGATPTDITNEAVSGNLMIGLAERPLSLEVLLGAERPLEPFLPGRKTPLSVDRIDARKDFDARLRASRYAYRIVVSRPEEILNLSLGGVPGVALARATGGRAKVRAIDLSTHLEAIDDVSKRLHIARDHQQALVARGWSSVQVDRGGPFRRMVMEEAELLLPVTFDATRLTVQLRGRSRASTVSLSLDGRDLGGKTLDAGWQQLHWDVPPGTWRSPVTSLVIHAPPGTELADVVIAREASVPARQ